MGLYRLLDTVHGGFKKKSPKRSLLQFFGIFLKYWNLDKFPAGSSRSDAMQCFISLASGGGGRGGGQASKKGLHSCRPGLSCGSICNCTEPKMGHISKP